MIFHDHSNLRGTHGAFSPSSAYQIYVNDYDRDRVIARYLSMLASEVGTALHEYARQRISNSLKMSNGDSLAVVNHLLESGIPKYCIDIEKIMPTLVSYVNDGIRYRMNPEFILYYSDIYMGTADTLSFNEKKGQLRIHDYKSGVIAGKMEQLLSYAALFCLEYNVDPEKIGVELRIYQNGDVVVHNPEANELRQIMENVERGNADILYFKKEV